MDPFWFTIAVAVGAYLLGSLNGSLISSRLFWRDDIRRHGSGNAGATNVLRTYGVKWTIAVALWDIGKGILAILLAAFLFVDGHEGLLAGSLTALTAGVFVILGHVFPVFFKFKGGKGVFTSLAVFYTWDWQTASIAFGLFILIVLVTRYVSLGSVCAVITLPILGFVFGRRWEAVAAYAAVMLLVIFLHRTNIKRLLNGTENKFGLKKKTT
ncbi:MAG: glycerol-3-phosphate 1-O-acyltransferase PlsY [Oscillospiraceae bacterium]|nr:glycerol-3-phosphate 1-O-acyltransferase PlsY [Oscillospiraceae bacterium]